MFRILNFAVHGILILAILAMVNAVAGETINHGYVFFGGDADKAPFVKTNLYRVDADVTQKISVSLQHNKWINAQEDVDAIVNLELVNNSKVAIKAVDVECWIEMALAFYEPQHITFKISVDVKPNEIKNYSITQKRVMAGIPANFGRQFCGTMVSQFE